MALRAEVVDLVRLGDLDQLFEAAAVGEVAIVQEESWIALVQVLEDMDDAAAVERGRAADDAVHLVAFLEQELGEIRAVLPGDPGNKRPLHSAISPCAVTTWACGIGNNSLPPCSK